MGRAFVKDIVYGGYDSQFQAPPLHRGVLQECVFTVTMWDIDWKDGPSFRANAYPLEAVTGSRGYVCTDWVLSGYRDNRLQLFLLLPCLGQVKVTFASM